MKITRLVLLGWIGVLLVACAPSTSPAAKSAGSPTPAPTSLRILTGSQVDGIQDIVDKFPKKSQISFVPTGAVDIKNKLEAEAVDFDAVWPESGITIQLGDKKGRVRNEENVMRSPVVFALKQSRAAQLGLVGRNDITLGELFTIIQTHNLRYGVSSASQSNCGSVWFLASASAAAGSPYVVTEEHLNNPQVQQSLKDRYGLVDRGSSSCSELTSYMLSNFDSLDAMVNYEAFVIAANRQLTSSGREPLYVIYPKGATAIAESALGYVDRGDVAKLRLFQEFQQFLKTGQTAKDIEARGWRNYSLGLEVSPASIGTLGARGSKVYDPDWGIDPLGRFDQIRMPNATVLETALNLYQSQLKKAAFTVLLLDKSGSMDGRVRSGQKKIDEMKKGVAALLHPTQAAQNFLQIGPDDITVVIPFDGVVDDRSIWTVRGNADSAFVDLLDNKVNKIGPGGGTNLYAPIVKAYDMIRSVGLGDRLPVIIMLTDGVNESGDNYKKVSDYIRQNNFVVPVFTIKYGDSNAAQLDEISNGTGGKRYDGDTDLITAFRTARGNN